MHKTMTTTAADTEWPARDIPQEAIALLRRRVHDFNACVPCGGVSPGARPDEALLPALFALLPTPLAVGISVAPPETKVMLSSFVCSLSCKQSCKSPSAMLYAPMS
jgi:hypothetical protein